MKLTKKQRKEVYKKALKRIETYHNRYLCTSISEVMIRKNRYVSTYQVPSIFPEIKLFEPTKQQINSANLGWWNDNNREIRVVALELCILMCK